jgi:hypothetical protein
VTNKLSYSWSSQKNNKPSIIFYLLTLIDTFHGNSPPHINYKHKCSSFIKFCHHLATLIFSNFLHLWPASIEDKVTNNLAYYLWLQGTKSFTSPLICLRSICFMMGLIITILFLLSKKRMFVFCKRSKVVSNVSTYKLLMFMAKL